MYSLSTVPKLRTCRLTSEFVYVSDLEYTSAGHVGSDVRSVEVNIKGGPIIYVYISIYIYI